MSLNHTESMSLAYDPHMQGRPTPQQSQDMSFQLRSDAEFFSYADEKWPS